MTSRSLNGRLRLFFLFANRSVDVRVHSGQVSGRACSTGGCSASFGMGNSAGVPVAGNGARDAVADGHLLAWRATLFVWQREQGLARHAEGIGS